MIIFTNLDSAVPTSRHNDGIGMVRRESDAGNPVRVAVILDGVLALSECVPQLDCLVSRARNDLTVVD